jgi:hypothetical protein
LKHTTQGKIKWDKPYPYQVALLEALQNGDDVFLNKSRRVGASWTCCAYVFWRVLFHPDISVLILSRKELYAKGLLRRVKFMYKNLPGFLKPKLGSNTQSEMSFVFQVGEEYAESNILSLTTTDESGRGEDAAVVLVDEAAFIPNCDETWAAVAPTTAFGGQKIVVSTPNGCGNFFHRNCIQLKAGHDIGFTYIEAHWKRDCGLTDAWFRKATAGLSAQKVLQEFELTFISAGAPFFDLNKLALCFKPPEEFPEIRPVMHRTEVSFSGVDTSEGHPRSTGEDPDYHSIVTLNELGIQIYGWHNNKMSLQEFAGHTMDVEGEGRVEVEGVPSKVHREFPGAMVIESFGSGDVTVNRHRTPDDVESYLVARKTTNTSKMKGLNSLRLAFNDEALVVTDQFTYQCLMSFEDQSTSLIERAGAAKGAFDDPVIALMLAWVEYKKHGGYQFDLSTLDMGGRRMVAVQSAEDLGPKELNKLLPVGPQFDGARIQVPGERLLDGLEGGRRGRTLRPPGM